MLRCYELKFPGFLAVGTEAGTLGITVTDTAMSSITEDADMACRYNYNLRGHHSK